MKQYYSLSEVGTVVPTILAEKPINPRTGKEYGKRTKTWWRWYYGLSKRDQSVIADLEA